MQVEIDGFDHTFKSIGIVRQMVSIDNLPTENLHVLVRGPYELPESVFVEVFNDDGTGDGTTYSRSYDCVFKVRDERWHCSNCDTQIHHVEVGSLGEAVWPRCCPGCGALNRRWYPKVVNQDGSVGW